MKLFRFREIQRGVQRSLSHKSCSGGMEGYSCGHPGRDGEMDATASDGPRTDVADASEPRRPDPCRAPFAVRGRGGGRTRPRGLGGA